MNWWVPLTQASDHRVPHRQWNSRWTQVTHTLHRCAVESAAEEHPLGAVLCNSNTGVGWTAEMFMKRRIIRCWIQILGVSLSNLNEGVRWTAGQGVRSSSAEATELQSLLLPNPRSPDEPMLGSSVHPMVTFENSSRRTHLTNVEIRVSVHPMLWFEFQLIQFKHLWVFRRFFCFQCVSMSTLSCLASKELECAYFHGVWCMVNLLVHEPS
jgi:hypothetical protein